MEEAACQTRCDGLFHHAQEVYLLGCNTLATKNEDRRTPSEYLQVLLDHGSTARRRRTSWRCGTDRSAELPGGAPPDVRGRAPALRLLVGRAEERVHRPMIASYLRAKGDYARWLDDSEGRSDANVELVHAFRGTALTQATAWPRPSRPPRPGRVCALYDEHGGVLDRLRIARDVMSQENFLAFVPTLGVFLARHPPQQLAPPRGRRSTRSRASDGAPRPGARPRARPDVSALKLELAHFSQEMGWMTSDDLRTVAVDGARELLGRPLTSDVIDVMCEITKHVDLGRSSDRTTSRPASSDSPRACGSSTACIRSMRA
jgi:hypothetical protein